MKLIRQEDTLQVSELEELDAANALAFRAAITAALAPRVKHIEIDLSHAECVDCGGLGALIALRKNLQQRHPDATLSLVHPTPPVQRLLQVTRTDRLFSMPEAENRVLPMPGLGRHGLHQPMPGAAGKDLPEEPLSAVA